MIKAEVVFDESEIHFNGYTLTESSDGTWHVSKESGKYLFSDYQLEKCVAHTIKLTIDELCKAEAKKALDNILRSKPVMDLEDPNLSYFGLLAASSEEARKNALGDHKAGIFETAYREAIEKYKALSNNKSD